MQYIKINPADNVAVALEDLSRGQVVEGVKLSVDIPRGHKIVLRDLKAGEDVIKYGYPIGHVTRDAAAGTLVDHTCIKTNLEGLLEYKYEPVGDAGPVVGHATRTFKGYRRADGQVGVRNQIWVIPTVGCVNGICEQIVSRFKAENPVLEGVDAIVTFPHNYGCSQLGYDHENTRTVLSDMVHHPNAGGVLVVSLGCENNQLDAFRELVGPVDESRVKMFVCQKVKDEVEYGVQCLKEIYAVASKDVREDVPVSELRVGLKCGGSDGLSGITANPLLGVLSDWIVEQGGTTVLTEVPEMFGAETILMNRCRDEKVFQKAVGLINGFKEYFIRHGQEVYENPSPGNKAGGITTLEDKSLGCTQKGGKGEVEDVLQYCEPVTHKGLNLVYGPGNDLCAITALMAAGAQIVLFTTGRGTPVGAPIPTVKVATNTRLAEHKNNWIDFNAGVLVQGAGMEETRDRFFEKILSIASGEKTRSEENDYREIAIFKDGVTL